MSNAWQCRRWKLFTFVLATLLVFVGTGSMASAAIDPLSWPAPGAGSPVPDPDAARLAVYGDLLSDAEMAQIDGEWWNVVLGAATGAISSVTSYTVSSYDAGWSLGGAAVAATTGAITGAIGSVGGPWVGSVLSGVAGSLMDRWF